MVLSSDSGGGGSCGGIIAGGATVCPGSSLRNGGEGGLGTSVTRGDSSGRRIGVGGLGTLEVDPRDPCLGVGK